MALKNSNGTWNLSHKEYQQLLEDSRFLENLRAAGVDSWDGYHYGYGGDPEE